MTKDDFEFLGKLFEAAMFGRLPYQHKENKKIKRLLENGMIEAHTSTKKFKDGLPSMQVSGYALTDRGNLLYCQECSRREKK